MASRRVSENDAAAGRPAVGGPPRFGSAGRSVSEGSDKSMPGSSNTKASALPGLPPVSGSGEAYVAKFDFTPTASGQIALREGSTVEVLEQGDDGWWQGCCNGAKGLFPGNYVEKVTPSKGGRPPVPPVARAVGGGGGGGPDSKLDIAMTEQRQLEARLAEVQRAVEERTAEKARLSARLDQLTADKSSVASLERSIASLKGALGHIATLVADLPANGVYT